jgi:pyruvate dehydrogenase E2 component (dihydrolipoamide acetyltransferase)
MAQTPVVMPKMSMTMTEGEVVEILVKVGDKVEKGQVVAVVGTDKTDMEVESDHEGEVTEISVGPGDVIDVGAPLFVLETVGEDLLAGMFDSPSESATVLAEEPAAEPQENPAPQAAADSVNVLAMPGARKLAAEQGIDLGTITPASPSGVIKQSDLPTPGTREAKARDQIARVVNTSTQVPQFSLSTTIGLGSPLAEDANSRFVQLARAWVRTLRALPRLNQNYVNGEFISVEEIRIAALVKSPLGFVSPTLSASNIDASEWEANAKTVLMAARENHIPTDNLQPATTSITDLGEFGIRQANTLLFPPQSSGFNVGAIRRSESGFEIDCTIVIDHRIADPGDGAEALALFATELQRELDVNS